MHTTGSLKERGALNALMNLTVEQKKIGVIAARLEWGQTYINGFECGVF